MFLFLKILNPKEIKVRTKELKKKGSSIDKGNFTNREHYIFVKTRPYFGTYLSE
jgi:hypothetical protein